MKIETGIGLYENDAKAMKDKHDTINFSLQTLKPYNARTL